MSGSVELFDNLDAVFGFGGSIKPAKVQPLGHAVAPQHIQQLVQNTQP